MTSAVVVCSGCRNFVKSGQEHWLKNKPLCDACYRETRKQPVEECAPEEDETEEDSAKEEEESPNALDPDELDI
jgi:hypothetical protein